MKLKKLTLAVIIVVTLLVGIAIGSRSAIVTADLVADTGRTYQIAYYGGWVEEYIH